MEFPSESAARVFQELEFEDMLYEAVRCQRKGYRICSGAPMLKLCNLSGSYLELRLGTDGRMDADGWSGSLSVDCGSEFE